MADEPSQNGTDPSGEPSGTEVERFEAFAKRLISVPKAEIDKARKREARKRAVRKTAP